MGYTNLTFACPFYLWDEKQKVHCEGGCRVAFQDKTDTKEYYERHCGNVNGWKDCSIAQSLLRSYERKDKEALNHGGRKKL